VKVGRSLLGGQHRDIVREDGVQRLRRPLGRGAALDGDACHLPGRMDARVRPSRNGESVGRRKDGGQSRPKLALDGPQARLRSPAAKLTPVVLEG
jgi:hypothetical protein